MNSTPPKSHWASEHANAHELVFVSEESKAEAPRSKRLTGLLVCDNRGERAWTLSREIDKPAKSEKASTNGSDMATLMKQIVKQHAHSP